MRADVPVFLWIIMSSIQLKVTQVNFAVARSHMANEGALAALDMAHDKANADAKHEVCVLYLQHVLVIS